MMRTAMKLPPEVLERFREQEKKGGKIGGKKSWEKMTAAERNARARKAGQASGAARKAKARTKRQG